MIVEVIVAAMFTAACICVASWITLGCPKSMDDLVVVLEEKGMM